LSLNGTIVPPWNSGSEQVFAIDWVDDKENGGFGEYWVDGGKFEGESLPEEFWDHYESVKGKKVPQAHRGSFFSCSC
jgi:hypothetical protein